MGQAFFEPFAARRTGRLGVGVRFSPTRTRFSGGRPTIPCYPRARAALASLDNQVPVSAASAWEVATKVRIGKLPGAESFDGEFTRRVGQLGFHELLIEVAHAERAGSLIGGHRDPFDRLLIAQAHALNIPIVGCDEIFDAYRVHRIW